MAIPYFQKITWAALTELNGERKMEVRETNQETAALTHGR